MSNHVPDGYQGVTPYLTVADAGALTELLKRVFDAEVTELIEKPGGGARHVELRIHGSNLMIGEGGDESMLTKSMLYVYVPDVDATYKAGLEAGGTSLQEPVDQPYGDRTGGFSDPSGTMWYLASRNETLTAEEIQQRMAESDAGGEG